MSLAARCLDSLYEDARVIAQRIVFDANCEGRGQAVKAVCMKR
jgi:hypothetical protein